MNNIGATGASAISEVLRYNTTLAEVDIGCNVFHMQQKNYKSPLWGEYWLKQGTILEQLEHLW